MALRDHADRVIGRIEMAWLDGDLTSVADLIHPHAVLVPLSGGPVMGGRELFVQQFRRSRTFRFERHEAGGGCHIWGDTAVSNDRIRGALTTGESSVVATLREVWVLVRGEAGWSVVWHATFEAEGLATAASLAPVQSATLVDPADPLSRFAKRSPASEADIAALGALPPAYAEFLRNSDGAEGRIGVAFVRLFSAREALECTRAFEQFVPGVLFFGGDGAEALFAIDRSDHGVIVTHHDDLDPKGLVRLADSFDGFLALLQERDWIAVWRSGYRKSER